MVALKKITKEDFNKSDLPELFNDHRTSRSFGELSSGLNGFKFAWQSTIVEPLITEVDPSIYAIGIDQNFAIVNLNNSKTFTNLNLTYNFLTTILTEKDIFVCTELEVIRLRHGDSYELLSSHPLPDLFEELIFEDDGVKIRSAENYVTNIN
jgi:hypothetical protein